MKRHHSLDALSCDLSKVEQHKVSSRLPVAGCRFESATGNWLLVADSRIGNRQLVAGCRFKNTSPYRQPLPRPYPNPTPVLAYTDLTLPYPTIPYPDPTRPYPNSNPIPVLPYPNPTLALPWHDPYLPRSYSILKYLIPNRQLASRCRLPIQKCKFVLATLSCQTLP